jgi:hypothetical protein
VSKKWSLALLCLGATAALASQWSGDYVARLRAKHVRRTTLVSAGNQRLAGFFDGLQPDPRWNAHDLVRTARQARSCSSSNPGLVGRILSIFERTAHAQGSCNSTSCYGHYASQLNYPECGTPGSGCTTYSTTSTGMICSQGSQYDGSTGCQGTGQYCSGICNVNTCTNWDGCCYPDWSECTQNSDCCSDYCDLSGGTGVCQSEYRPRGSK